jgi:hypothetical protein
MVGLTPLKGYRHCLYRGASGLAIARSSSGSIRVRKPFPSRGGPCDCGGCGILPHFGLPSSTVTVAMVMAKSTAPMVKGEKRAHHGPLFGNSKGIVYIDNRSFLQRRKRCR